MIILGVSEYEVYPPMLMAILRNLEGHHSVSGMVTCLEGLLLLNLAIVVHLGEWNIIFTLW